jgi:phosphatidate cytidylyltransferase
MSDDSWRRDRDDEPRRPLFADDDDDDRAPLFGDPVERAPLFGDDQPTRNVEQVEEGLSFRDSDTGPLPHWTEPPTGELPSIEPGRAAEEDEPLDELDVWSSFTSESPVWSDDLAERGPDPSGEMPVAARRTGQHDVVDDVTARGPARITIGTDPSGIPRRPPVQTGRRRGGQPGARPSAGRTAEAPSGRDLPTAIAVGVLIAAVFLGAVLWRPAAVVAFVVVLLGLAAVEFYGKVSERGYRPAVLPGVLACVAAPLAAYWLGEAALPLVFAFGFMAIAGGFIGARSVDAGPLPNVSITMLGVIWIGLLGSYAALLAGLSALPGSPTWGTDTFVLLAIGVVANDVGAYLVGSAAGRTPLRPWISPNKSVEGLIGGALFTIVALVVVGITGRSDTWTSTPHLLALAVVISVTAPMGDLVESMFKRNLDVKDFGTIVKGHGGILDRFDGFLFALPAAYYLTLVLEPWTAG